MLAGAPSTLRPIGPQERLVAALSPVAAAADEPIREHPYEHDLGFSEAAIWGELLTTLALARRAVGAATDGAVRDVTALRRLAFPVFAAAVSANHSRGRVAVTGWGDPVVCASMPVAGGDVVLGDADGVIVVPAASVDEVIAGAWEERAREERAPKLLTGGTSAADVWREHGVL